MLLLVGAPLLVLTAEGRWGVYTEPTTGTRWSERSMLAVSYASVGLIRHSYLRAGPRGLCRTSGCFMPEGPEVTIHAECLNRACASNEIVSAEILSGRYFGSGSSAGRNAPPANWGALQAMLPAKVDSVQSKGKFMYFRLSASAASATLWSTLGMTGAWSLTPSSHARVMLKMHSCDDGGDGGDGEPWVLFYNDMRNFGTITFSTEQAQLEAKLASLGPSWVSPGGLSRSDFLAVVERQCANKRGAAVPVAKFLMDQSKTAGIGNYILSETLYLARIDPWASCGALDTSVWEDVHAAASDVIYRSLTSQRALAAAQADAATLDEADAKAPMRKSTRSLSATRGTTYTFELHVFSRKETADGLVVRKAEGPHKRSVWWVPERQTRGRQLSPT